MAERRLLNCAIEAINTYRPMKAWTIIESITFWLARLSWLVRPTIDLNHTKSKIYNRSDDENNGLNIGDGKSIGKKYMMGYFRQISYPLPIHIELKVKVVVIIAICAT